MDNQKDIKGQKTKDKKQDQEIKNLKQKLKDLAGKYLKKKKKEEKDPKKYGKIKKRLTKKTTGANSKSELMNLINMLKAGGRQVERVTGQPIQAALNPATIGSTAQRILKDQVEKAAAGPIEEYLKAKDAFLNVKDKYNNGTLGINDINNLYEKASKFAESVQENLPSKEVLLATYSATSAGFKKVYDQLKRFMNRRSGDINQNPIDPNQSPRTGSEGPGEPQGPAPAPTPTPPPSSPPGSGGSGGGLQQEEPVQEQQPAQEQPAQEQPAPRQMSTQELQDQGLIGRSVNPWVGGALIGAGALAGGGAIYRSFLGIKEQAQDAKSVVREMAQRQRERTSLNTKENLRQALNNANEERDQALNRLNSEEKLRELRQDNVAQERVMTRVRRPNLRARDDQKQARLDSGEVQRSLSEDAQFSDTASDWTAGLTSIPTTIPNTEQELPDFGRPPLPARDMKLAAQAESETTIPFQGQLRSGTVRLPLGGDLEQRDTENFDDQGLIPADLNVEI